MHGGGEYLATVTLRCERPGAPTGRRTLPADAVTESLMAVDGVATVRAAADPSGAVTAVYRIDVVGSVDEALRDAVAPAAEVGGAADVTGKVVSVLLEQEDPSVPLTGRREVARVDDWEDGSQGRLSAPAGRAQPRR